MMLASGGGFAGLAFDPLPNLPRLFRVCEDNEMFVRRFCDLSLDLPAKIVVRKRAIGSQMNAVMPRFSATADNSKVRLSIGIESVALCLSHPSSSTNKAGKLKSRRSFLARASSIGMTFYLSCA